MVFIACLDSHKLPRFSHCECGCTGEYSRSLPPSLPPSISPSLPLYYGSFLCLTVAPDIAAREPNVTVIEGTMATLMCSATGDPVPVQTWSRNGNELRLGGQYQISGNGSMLTVQNVAESRDEGMFTCHASNVAGNDLATITLNVLSK